MTERNSCPTCGCDTYNETGRCESALQLDEKDKRIDAAVAELKSVAQEIQDRFEFDPFGRVFMLRDAVLKILKPAPREEMLKDG